MNGIKLHPELNHKHILEIIEVQRSTMGIIHAVWNRRGLWKCRTPLKNPSKLKGFFLPGVKLQHFCPWGGGGGFKSVIIYSQAFGNWFHTLIFNWSNFEFVIAQNAQDIIISPITEIANFTHNFIFFTFDKENRKIHYIWQVMK